MGLQSTSWRHHFQYQQRAPRVAILLLLMCCPALPRRLRAQHSPIYLMELNAVEAATAEVCAPQPAQIAPALRETKPSLNIRADLQEREQNIYRLRGHVEVTYQGAKLSADEATYNGSTGEVVAKGHVAFTDTSAHLEADEAHYNVLSGKGWFSNSQGFIRAKIRPRSRVLVSENPLYVRAQRVDRLDTDTYVARRARVTSCSSESKGWSVGARRARIELGDKIAVHGADLRFLRAPLFYSPIFIHSVAQNPRQTGLLLPHIGHSSQKGYIFGEGLFWAMHRSADMLFGVENYTKRGLGTRGRFRARPSPTSEVTLDYFGVNDKGREIPRQLRAPGETIRATGQARNLIGGFRGVVDVDYVNSLAFRQTFTDNFTQAITSELRQTGFLTKNFDAYSVNFYVSRYQNFLSAQPGPGDSITIRQSPSVSFSGMDKQVGQSPFYFAFEGSLAGVARGEPGFETPRLSERLDFHPQVTLRSKPFWGFHLTPSAGVQATRYGTGLRTTRGSFNRLLGEFSIDLRPPSLEKVSSRPLAGHRWKHVIEPDVRYRLVRASDARELGDLVRYDQTDILAETNEVEYSLTNSLLMRKDVPLAQADMPQARELLSLRLSQKYYFDPTFGGALARGRRVVLDPTISLTGFAFAQGRRLSPVVSVLKFSPFSSYDTELRADLNPSGGGVLNAGITSYIHTGPLGVALTEFFINRTATLPTPLTPPGDVSTLPSFNLLRTVITYGDPARRGFSGAFGLDHNFASGVAHQVVSQISYNFGCFGLDFEYRRFALGTFRRENQFRIALSLANIGTFGNLKPRERLY